MSSFPIKPALVALCLIALPSSAEAASDPVYDLFEALLGDADAPPLKKSPRRAARGRNGDHASSFSGSMVASFYGGGERLNSHTANGERFYPGALTAAHRSLPFGTLLRVCYRACATVRVNDRGPASWTGRSLDLSRGAAHAIGMPGVARVSVSRW